MKLKALNKWERSWWHLHLNLAQQHRRPLNCLVWLEFHSILHLDGTVLLCSPKGARKQRSETPFTCGRTVIRLTEGNRGLYTTNRSLHRKKNNHTLMARWTAVNDQQGKLFLISSLLTKSDTKETHFREDRWHSLQLALAQVKSPECLLGNASVVNPVPATYSMCWLLVTLPASLHS